MHITRITFRNILSYGNNNTTIEFTEENVYKTIGIIGKNGKGKTTIYDVIFLALFDTPFRDISKNKLLNRENKKDGYVKIEFVNNGKNYIIERGLGPSFVKIWCNDVEQKLDGHSRDIQKFIETKIIGINEKLFRLIFMIGSGVFTSFFEFGIDDRRKIFEFMLGINILTVMLEKIKKTNKQVNSDIEHLKAQIEKEVELKSIHESKIEDLNELQTKTFSEEIKDLKKNLKSCEKILKKIDINKIKENQEKNQKKLDELNKEREEWLLQLKENNVHISTNAKMLNFLLKNDNCPTCTQPIDEKFKKGKIKENETDIKKLEEDNLKIQAELDKVKVEIKDLNDVFNEIMEEMRTHKTTTSDMERIQKNITKYEDKTESISKDSSKQIQKIKKTIKEKNKKIKELAQIGQDLTDKAYYNGFLIDILGDKGIKKYVYDIVFKKINKYINFYMSEFLFTYKVKINSNLSSFFYAMRGDEIEYKTFSNGEKMIINFSFIFGVLKFLEEFYGFKSNFLFFDEILDTSLDATNKSFLMEALEKFQKNIVIISHDHELSSIFNECYIVDKVDKFSYLKKL